MVYYVQLTALHPLSLSRINI